MTAMILMIINFINALLKFIIINIIAAISWPPPLILHPGFLKAAPYLYSLVVFAR